MLTLLYGTHAARDEIFSRIAKDVSENLRAYLIVPDQKALLAENALMNYLPKSAALLVDAVGFSRLANLVCRRYGSLTYSYANDSAKVLTMYRTVKKISPHLNIFANELQSGTLEALCSLMGEFRACLVTPEDLNSAADTLGEKSLATKLRDLALIYTEYESALHKKFALQADDIDTLAELLSENDFFGDAHIYIDSFISFTKQELTVLSHMLSRGKDVTVALPFSRRGNHMAECADTRKKLLSLCAKLGTKVEEKYTVCDAPAALEFVKDNLWDLGSKDVYEDSTAPSLTLVECTDKTEEASLCLKEIFTAVNSGCSYSDIAIIARNADSYTGILDRALARCKIPFFFSKKKSAAIMPLTRLILSALSLYVYNFKESDVSAYIKTGLTGTTDDECDLFEEYINRWNICGRARYLDGEDFTMSGKGYTSEVTDTDDLYIINETKKKIALPLSRFCDSLDGAKTVKDFATAVYEYLTEMNIRERSCDADFAKYFGTELVSDAIRLWNITMDALDTMVDAAGEEVTTAADFCTLVKLLFSSIDIAEIPTSKDQVIIGNADTIRIDERKIVIILGANEGVFPAPVSESPTLCESERNLLKDAGVTLSQDLALRSARELYHFVRAIDFATEKATVSYCLADLDGSKCEPSFAVTRLIKLFPALEKYSFGSLDNIDKLYYPEHAAESIGCLGKDTEAVLKETLSHRGLYTPPIDNASLLSNSNASLTPNLAKSILGNHMSLSQSRIDCYGACKFNYFMKYMISLTDTSPFEFNAANKGTFIHSVLENFIGKVHEQHKKLSDLSEDEIEELANELCSNEVNKTIHSQGKESARMLFFFDRLKRNILLVIKNLVNEFKNSSFEPLALEYSIGQNGHAPLKVTLSDGATVSLNGVADRVDIFKKDGKVYIRIADYKSGDKKFSEKDLEKGTNLQLLIYLFTLCHVADKQFFDLIGVNSTDDIMPAAATYFVIKPPKIELDSSNDDVLELASDELKRIGFIFNTDTLANAIDRTEDGKFKASLIEKNGEDIDKLFEVVKNSIANISESMRDGRIDIKGTDTSMGDNSPCVYCEFAHVCRKEKTIEEGDNA